MPGRRSTWLLAALAWLLAAAPAMAQLAGIEVEATVDRTRLTIDQRIQLTLAVRAPEAMAIRFPEPGDRIGPFAVVSTTVAEPESDGADRLWRRDYLLEPEQLGPLTVPALEIAIEPGGGAPAIAALTEPIELTVEAITPDDVDLTKPRDIAPPVELRRRGLPASVWLAGAVAALLAAGAAWWWWRRRRPRLQPPTPPIPAHVAALAALAALRVADGGDPAAIEAFHIRLAEILRRYLDARFGWRAPLRTTEELLAIVATAGGAPAAGDGTIADLLRRCDLVKFARHRPGAAEMRDALARLRGFIERTAADAAPGPLPAE
jgi:hypothetical protein